MKELYCAMIAFLSETFRKNEVIDMYPITDSKLYNVHTTDDIVKFFTKLKSDLLRNLNDKSVQIYTYKFLVTSEAQEAATKQNKTIEEYAMDVKVHERESMLHSARFEDASHDTMLILVRATEDSIDFQFYYCMEQVLRDFMNDKCEIYLESKGRCRIFTKDAIYCPFKLNNFGKIVYMQMLKHPKFKNKQQQKRYMLLTLLLSRKYVIEMGGYWYYGRKKDGSSTSS